MRNILILAALSTSLAACGGKGGLSGRGPDELAIMRAAPLVVPPDFALAPPTPGAPRPIGVDSQAAAMEALFGPGVKPPPRSQAEQGLLDRAGAGATDPAIRSQAGDPRTSAVNKGPFLQEVLAAPVGARDPSVADVRVPG
ncbi:DUF3035 domain-containing protein [Sandarakinorhabdus rubra]|uniref:DUF3035 domain-containing protein n=1 Tax=Sandarakinorhabdus rubra TaxID=2672568 RepID=UPI0013DCB0B5|nr:DUF3035 domain-containing protein [Sandarakinorhabdus rubra]